MTKQAKLGWLLGSIVALGGCTGVAHEESASNESALDAPPTVARPDYPTQASGVGLLRGYTPLFEQTTDVACARPVDGLAVQASGVTSRLDYVLVSSRQELAKELGIDLDLKIKYGVGSFNPTFSFVDTFKDGSRSVFVLVRASHTYKVSRAPGVVVDLTSDATEATADPGAFLPACGSHFIDGITHGARLLLGLRFDVDSLEAAQAVKGGLGLSVGIGPVGVDGGFSARMKNAIVKSGATVSLSVASQGYLIEKNGSNVDPTADAVKALLGDGFTDQTVTGLHGLITAMAESVKSDLCRDAPGGTGCSGAGPGYLANPSRRASVLSVDLRPYATLPSAPRGLPWVKMTNALKRADDTLRALAPTAARIDAIHTREIRPFLDASDAERNAYGLKSDTARAVDTSDLVARATDWDRRFRPRAGSDVKPLEDLIESCFVSASAGVFDACDPEAREGKEHTQAEASLARYEREGRVLPLAYRAIEPLTFGAAKARCQSLHLRLPSREEATQMAVALRRSADLATGGDLPRTMWHAGPSTYCTAFYNPPGAGASASLDRCVEGIPRDAARLPSLCVASDGPFGGR